MNYSKATKKDIEELIKLRLAYLNTDYNGLSKDMELAIEKKLSNYYLEHLGKSLHIYVAKDHQIVSCVFLVIYEKPWGPAFPTGKIGTVFNVYTMPPYRRQGIAKHLMEMMLKEAREMKLDLVDLKATDDGYPLYKSLGFEDDLTNYHPMKIVLQKMNPNKAYFSKIYTYEKN